MGDSDQMLKSAAALGQALLEQARDLEKQVKALEAENKRLRDEAAAKEKPANGRP